MRTESESVWRARLASAQDEAEHFRAGYARKLKDEQMALEKAAALEKERDAAKAKAEQYERDWYAAKNEFGDAVAKARASIAAAEERGRRSGVEEAAMICENERAGAWASSRAADAKGDHRVGAADAGTASTAQRLGERIRALAKEGKP